MTDPRTFDFPENMRRYEVKFRWTRDGRDKFFQALIRNHGRLLRSMCIGGELRSRYIVTTLVEISKYRIDGFREQCGARVRPGQVAKPQ